MHELGGGLSEQPLLLAEIFADEHVGGRGRRREKLSAASADRCLCRCLCHGFALLTALRLGSISLTTCQPSTNCSDSTAASPSSPADRAGSARRWRKGSRKPAPRSCCARAARNGSRRPLPKCASRVSRSKAQSATYPNRR